MTTMTTQVSRVIRAEPGRVWETLTSREGMKAYMMGADVDTDWQVGSPITMRGEFHGKAYEDHGEVRSFEPRKRLSYTHISSSAPEAEHLVTIELAPRDDATEVTISQGSDDPKVTALDRQHKAEHMKMWGMMLAGLEEAVGH